MLSQNLPQGKIPGKYKPPARLGKLKLYKISI